MSNKITFDAQDLNDVLADVSRLNDTMEELKNNITEITDASSNIKGLSSLDITAIETNIAAQIQSLDVKKYINDATWDNNLNVGKFNKDIEAQSVLIKTLVKEVAKIKENKTKKTGFFSKLFLFSVGGLIAAAGLYFYLLNTNQIARIRDTVVFKSGADYVVYKNNRRYNRSLKHKTELKNLIEFPNFYVYNGNTILKK